MINLNIKSVQISNYIIEKKDKKVHTVKIDTNFHIFLNKYLSIKVL